jgi:hypothetical protein
MADPDVDPTRFFDAYPRFLDSSETGPMLDRLNARQQVLIHDNRHLLRDARVLDLASHDGRFAFAALQAGAASVVGIDHKAHLVRVAREHMDAYGIQRDRHRFLVGDLFDCMDEVGPIDVVLCFGILYHLADHLRLFDRIAELGPRTIIVDTRVSDFEGAVIEIRSALGESPPAPGADLEGYPTRGALEAMLSSFGWTWEYTDWIGTGMADRPQTGDYRKGLRVSVVITCPEHGVPADVKRRAVEQVLAQDQPREVQFITTTMVAQQHGISPLILRAWVRQAERARARRAGFAVD